MKRRFLALILTLCMLAAVLPAAVAADAEVKIAFTEAGITVDGKAIGEDATAAVYLEKRNEQHKDVPDELKDVINSVVVVAKAGTYRFSGQIYDGQIAVRAGEEDAVKLILDGADITNRTAPAIQVYTAKQTYDEGKYFVTIELADGSENYLTGSHTVKKDPLEEDQGAKHDATISSNISLGFEGKGSVEIAADNEGIEVKYGHLTVNGGVFHIAAADDPVNGSEDGVAVITINDGYFACYVDPLKGFEGDGIDSNGYIKINGGTLITRAHPTSMDGGVDSDMGSYINGGTVVAAGNMYDAIKEDSKQLFMMLEFVDETDELIVVTDKDDKPVFAYDFPNTYTYILFSMPTLTEGIYHVYIGGEIVGKEQDGLYTEITSYSGGEQMRHGGASSTSGGGFPAPPAGFTPPDFSQGFPAPPEGFELPEGFTPPDFSEGFTPPAGGMPFPGGMQSSSEEATYDFDLTMTSRTFTNVVSDSMAAALVSFSDLQSSDWFFDDVLTAAGLGLIDGMGDGTYSPNGNMTYAQAIKLAACMNQMFNTAEVTLENGKDVWYSTYAAYCLENGIIEKEPADYSAVITRSEYAAIFANALPEKGYDDINDFEDDVIPDVKMTDKNAEAIYKLYRAGILQGSDDQYTFNPDSNIKRSEIASIVVRMMRTDVRIEFAAEE